MLPYRRAARLFNAVICLSAAGLLLLFLQRPTLEVPSSVGADRGSRSLLRIDAYNAEGKADALLAAALGPNYKNIAKSQPDNPGPAQPPETRDGPAAAAAAAGLSHSAEASLREWAADLGRATKLDVDGGAITGRQIVASLRFLNDNFVVLNTDRLGPVVTARYVIVIQVHSRIEYLKYLVDTLSKTRGIEDALLVFSHDVNIEAIDQLVRNITFARVLQIFYPYNMQLFPHVFPGQDPRDCPEKIKKEEALVQGCHNAQWPDKYGNYRVAKFTQIKHHWWWKMNYVMDGVVARYNLQDRWVLLLEEDHYVSPDALHTLEYIVRHKDELCAECEIISLGFYLKTFASFGTNIDRLGVHPWFSSKHNMGMALRADTWAKIKNCSSLFCSWDDYNWDWSLLQISVKCLPRRFRVIFAKAPRVLHVGDCGVHTHRCAVHNAAEAARKLLDDHASRLFPDTFRVTEISKRMLKPSKENGGWGDQRDRALCMRNANPLREPSTPEEGANVLDDLFSSSVVVGATGFGGGAGNASALRAVQPLGRQP